jgi:hypothetical protein
MDDAAKGQIGEFVAKTVAEAQKLR